MNAVRLCPCFLSSHNAMATGSSKTTRFLIKYITMKKILLICVAALAFGCDANNRSSEHGAGSELEERAPVDPAESDSSSIHSDTTTSGGMNRQNQYDTLQ
jgi:hypothetical protein